MNSELKDKNFSEFYRKMAYSNEILDLINSAQDMTTSDLQACVDALVNKIMERR